MEAKNSWRKLKRSGAFKRKVNRNFLLLKSTTPTNVPFVKKVEEDKCTTHEQQKVDVVENVPSGSAVSTYDDYTTDNSDLSSTRESIIESSDTDDNKDDTFREDLKKWALGFYISHHALKSLSEIVNKRLPNIVPNDPRTLLRPNKINLHFFSVGSGKYWHNGLSLQLKETLEHIDDVPNIISLIFNIDGLPLYKSSRHQVWPILCQISEKRYLSPIVVGIYEGTGKPSDLEAYFTHLVTELKDHLQNPMEIKTKKGLHKICTIRIKAFICDSPARALIKGVCNFNGKHGFLKCTVVGEYSQISHTVVFTKIDCPKRNDADFRSKKNGNHHKHDSPLLQLESMDMIEDIPVGDSLHLIDLGITKRLLVGWRDGNFGNKNLTKLCFRDICKISEFLLSCKLPSEIHRSIRSLEELAYWKASEFHTFLMYLSFINLKDVLCSEVYYHFLTYFCAITVCSNEKHFRYLRLAEEMLKYFITTYANIYGKEYLTSNVHNLCHLIDEIKRFGVLQNFNAYPFENKLYSIKKLVRNGNKPLSQIAKRLTEQRHIELQNCDHQNTQYPFFSTKRNKNGIVSIIHLEKYILSTESHNKWFLSTENKVIEILSISNDGRKIQINRNSLKNCTDAFETPIKSSFLGIYMCDVNNTIKSKSTYLVENLKCKIVAIPHNEHVYFVPLIHTL